MVRPPVWKRKLCLKMQKFKVGEAEWKDVIGWGVGRREPRGDLGDFAPAR